MSSENFDYLYKAFAAKDRKLDGRYFVGVASTGIYCRPVCTAKMPKPENCHFYGSAAAAELDGYRPCLLCRPELAPGHAQVDAAQTILRSALKLIHNNLAEEIKLPELAQRLGISDRHLRRIFQDEIKVSPADYIVTARLLLAKELLTDTNLRVADVAFAAGFGSLRRFNAVFREKYRMAPSDFRKRHMQNDTRADSALVKIKIGYRAPFRYEALLDFFQRRAIAGVEKVEDGKFYRSLCLPRGGEYSTGYVAIANNSAKSFLEIEVSEGLVREIPQLLSIVRALFDLDCDPATVEARLADFNRVVSEAFLAGTRTPGSVDGFEMCVRAIIGQLISVEKATDVLGKFCQKFGRPVVGAPKGLDVAFPLPEDIAQIRDAHAELCPLGMTRVKADAIRAVARECAQEHLDFGNPLKTAATKEQLLAIKGIGDWTANYVAMRAMGDPDVFLTLDYAIGKVMKELDLPESVFDRYKPYRSYLTVGMWELGGRPKEKK